MPNFYIYSHEPLPNPDLMGKPGYTPDSEYVGHGGFRLGYLPPNEWIKLPEREYTIRHRDWLDRKGTREIIYMEDIVPAMKTRFEGRGVIILDHEPTEKEKKELGQKSAEINEAYRMKCVEWYENQVREKEVTGHGRTTPTPYENMCYETLGLTKPYSVEAMRAQRHPGEAVGEQIVAALDRLEKRRNDEAKAEKSSHSKPSPVGA